MNLTHPILSDMLSLVDTILAQATGNKAFNAHIPLLDTSVNSVRLPGSLTRCFQ